MRDQWVTTRLNGLLLGEIRVGNAEEIGGKR